MNTISEIIHEIDDGTLPDASRRKALVAATSVMGGIGLLAAAAPFVASLEPSEAAKARGGAGQRRYIGDAGGQRAHGVVARQAGVADAAE